jgi:hypothetical protein
VEAEESYDDLPEELPEDKKEKSTHWSRARAGLKKLSETRTQIAKLEADLKARAEAPPEVVAENARLKEELAKYKDTVVEINIELDPDFRAKYVQGRESKVEKAATKLTNFGGNGDALKDALAMKEGRARTLAIKEAMGEVDPIDQTRVMSLVTDIENLDEEAADVRANSQKEWEKRKQAMAADAETKKTATEANKKAIFDTVAEALKETFWPLRKVEAGVEGADEWNAESDKAREKAWSITQPGVKPEEYAKAALAYGIVDRLQTLLSEAHTKIRTLTATVNENASAAPGFRGGGEQKAEERLTPVQKFNREMAKSRGEE